MASTTGMLSPNRNGPREALVLCCWSSSLLLSHSGLKQLQATEILISPLKSPLQWRSRFAVLFHKWLRKLDWATAATQMERFVGDKLADDRWQPISATYGSVFTSSDAHILLPFLLENQLFPTCSYLLNLHLPTLFPASASRLQSTWRTNLS